MLMARHLKKIEIPIDALLPIIFGDSEYKINLPGGTQVYDLIIDRKRRVLVIIIEHEWFPVCEPGEEPVQDRDNYFYDWTEEN